MKFISAYTTYKEDAREFEWVAVFVDDDGEHHIERRTLPIGAEVQQVRAILADREFGVVGEVESRAVA